jgi:hypothetical protein
MKPATIPYRWFWAIGGVLLIIGVIMIINRLWFSAAGVGFGGIALVTLGFVERHRGAPRA